MTVTGLLLAAGAGRRIGGPKALVAGDDGTPWVVSSLRTLRDGGCDDVVVVLGAQAQDVRARLEAEAVSVVEATEWDEGMGASLRTGLGAIGASSSDCALVHLVDLPDVGSDVVRRVLHGAGRTSLARATYDGRPGHPVLLGRDHWAAIAGDASGDEGARAYLRANQTALIECSDLATGHDIDSR